MKFDVRYYLVAILFILFDLEIAFLFPWAVVLQDIGCSASVDDGVPRHPRGRLHLRVEEGRARMGVGSRPGPLATDLLRRREPEKGFVSHHPARHADQLGAHRLDVADDLRPGLLRGRDDARRRRALRPRPLRDRVPPEPAPVRRDDRRRHAVQQDGAGAAQGLRPDGRAALGDLDGLVRERRRLLPLLVLGGARLRPHRAGRHLRARAARRPPKRCSTASSSCRTRSSAPTPSRADGAMPRIETITLQAALPRHRSGLANAQSSVTDLGEVTVVVRRADRSMRTAGRCATTRAALRAADRPLRRRLQRYGDGAWDGPRFAVVYHLLSSRTTWRLRVRTFAPDDDFPGGRLVIGVWPGANWFEREAFDLFGIVFTATPTCAASSPTTASSATRSARTSRSRATSRCATTPSRSA